MSYERDMLAQLAMPTKQEVGSALLIALFRHNGTVKEFAAGEEITSEIADMFSLNEIQRKTVLERIYKKEHRTVKTPVWHRLLFRAADFLVKEKLVTNPSATELITGKKEWMLTEKGFEQALELLHIPAAHKEILPIESFELKKEVKKIRETPLPAHYNPIASETTIITRKISLRSRGFRHAVIESYNYTCCVCGLKIQTPDLLQWEVEAAHIIPHSARGKDDIWNGIALCHLHHWAFDVGWFSVSNDYRILISSHFQNIASDYGTIGDYSFFKESLIRNKNISVPDKESLYPHKKSLEWHRTHIFYTE